MTFTLAQTDTEAQTETESIKKALDTFLGICKQVCIDVYDYFRSGVMVTWDSAKYIGQDIYDGGKGVVNSVGGQCREVSDNVFTTIGQGARDFGNYGVATARDLYSTGVEAATNTYNGSGTIADKGMEGIEYVGKGGGSTLGAAWDGFTTGFNYGRNVGGGNVRSL